MKRFIYMLAAFALMGAVSCQPDEEVAVHASFTTDKESYDVGDPVVLTNTSTAENALIAICKWELGKGVVSYETTPENISYDQAGEYVIKLTVTSDRGAKKSSFEKTIRVVDNNIRPVADFTWSPEKVVAGEPVQFTDRSTDEDGEVVAWEWKFGTTTSDKQNPEFTFAAQGATEVSLTVTDNKKGRNTKTVTIDVGRGAISLDLLWSYPYDDTKDAYVFGTSPAVSPDGEYVYVTSTGYSLVCFTKAGERLWAFDIGKDGASAENNSGSIKVQSPTPSVDEDGTVYALAGFNEPNKGAGGSAFYAVSGGAGGVYMNPVYEGTARPACTAVPREVQRRALREALALTADLGWIDRQGVSKNVYNRVQACEYLQRRIARTLLEKLGTLGLAASKADDPYTADLMAKDLVAWFEERLRSREPLTDHVRNLQQSLLKSTVAAANVKDKPSSGSGSAFALFDGSGSLSDGGDLFPATDAGALPDMPAERRADDFTPLGAGEVQGAAYGYRTPRVIPAFREHLFYGLLLDMKAMYRRGAASAPLADTRSFCRYMADRIDRELAVE